MSLADTIVNSYTSPPAKLGDVRAESIYVNGRKAFSIHGHTRKLDTHAEPILTLDGLSGHSDGIKMATLEVQGIVPTQGSVGTQYLEKAAHADGADAYVDVALACAGALRTTKMRVLSYGLTSDAATGMLTETATLHGGLPSFSKA